MLNTIISSWPHGLPFALKINEVTPIIDAINVVALLHPNIKNDAIIIRHEPNHKSHSYMVK